MFKMNLKDTFSIRALFGGRGPKRDGAQRHRGAPVLQPFISFAAANPEIVESVRPAAAGKRGVRRIELIKCGAIEITDPNRVERRAGARHGFRDDRVEQLNLSSAGYRAAFPPIPTRSKASLPPRARSAPFVPLCPKVPDLLENQDRGLAFSDDFRALTLLGRQYHRSHYC